MRDGRGIDAATLGFEGMVGAWLALGEKSSPYLSIVQLEGAGLRIPADDFSRLLEEDQGLRELILRYVGILLVQSGRSAACNRLHAIDEQLARWLLHTHDWVASDRFHLTQDYLAMMLGVRRASVTDAAGALQRAGIITYQRGDITILSREALEEAACEDYAAVREAYDRLFAL
jgi:CRP-like cAMP-binding protein